MTRLVATITDAGMQAVFNAASNGIQATISHIGLGDGNYTATPEQTEMVNERQNLPISDTERLSINQIRVAAVASGPASYWVTEAGFYLDDGTLFAIWSNQDQPLGFKAVDGDFIAALDLVLTRVDGNNVTVQTTGPSLAPLIAGPLAKLGTSIVLAHHNILKEKLARREEASQ